MLKANKEIFLHISDVHLKQTGTASNLSDTKEGLLGFNDESREEIFTDTLSAIAKELKCKNVILSGVILTGDTNSGGDHSGMEFVKKQILENLSEIGVHPQNIVVTPGNHDVPIGPQPSTPERYKEFVNCWRKENFITPYLDGIDDEENTSYYENEDKNLVILPMNSSNWSHSERTDIDQTLKEKILGGKYSEEEKKKVEKLFRFDAAGISKSQLKSIDRSLGGLSNKNTIKVLATHHHLLPVNSRAEVKAFEGFTNLGQLRQFLNKNKVDIVIHGHKHYETIYEDFIIDNTKSINNQKAHKVTIISGGVFDPSNNESGMQLIIIEGQPSIRKCSVVSIPIASVHNHFSINFESQETVVNIQDPEINQTGTLSISSDNIDDLYIRACEIVRTKKANNRGLTCTLDLSELKLNNSMNMIDKALPFPRSYPYERKNQSSSEWLDEIVGWWQNKHSVLQERIPYIHGNRLHNYAGKIDQIERISNLLDRKPSTSKAIAVLIDPIRDFSDISLEDKKTDFASFCLIQFTLEMNKSDETYLLNATAYYRAQEFRLWWPVNVAEIYKIMTKVCEKLESNVYLGKITTIATDARIIKSGKTPTKVAIPAIDQWLDTNKTRIPLIASALIQSNGSDDADNCEILELWFNALDELKASTNGYDSEGVPLAIESLDFLSDCLKQSLVYPSISPKESNNERIRQLYFKIKSLADENRNYNEDTKQDKITFVKWGKNVTQLIEEIKNLSLVIGA